MKKLFVTTFNKKLYDKYAYKLIDSYKKTNQQTPLYCYVEDDVRNYPKQDNIHFINLYSVQPECYKFVQRNEEKHKNLAKISYLLDAVRFSYKVFAQNDSRKYGDMIYYVDSDIEFKKNIPDEWYLNCLPEDTFITLHDRLGFYTETGFLAFNNIIKNKKGEKISDVFFNQYISYYVKDLIYALPSFTDCHALDATRWRFKFLTGLILEYSNYKEKHLDEFSKKRNFNVSDSELINPYLIHKKGNLKNINS